MLLELADIEVASVPWDTSPALRQEPTLNPWCGTGDVAPGTLLHSGKMPLEVRVTPGPAGANGSSQELVTTFEYETETNQPERIVGVLGETGELTHWINVYRTRTGSSEELVTTFEYETETNQPERIVDPLGAETVIERNDLGLAERTTRAAGADESSATEYSYNAHGQPVEVVDPRLHRTTYEYFEDDESAGSSGCATTGSAG
ncbi:MAG: hypothetical protein GY835_18120, partial [bacterium]|nr:hypothetical protein [bacterium]